MNKPLERLYNGMIKENPTFVLTLGMCPTLAVTTSAVNGLGMGLTTAAVLALSNLFISLLRKIIPDKVRIPAFIVIVASFVTMVQLLLEAYLPSLNASLGIYISLIVVNCIILGRAESYAYHNPPVASFFDGVGMGLGFTVALTLLGIVREFIGSGTFFGMRVFPEEYGVTIFVLAPGAFFVLAALVAVQNFIKDKLAAKGKDVSKIGSGCGMGCAGCPEGLKCTKPEAKAYRKDKLEFESISEPEEKADETAVEADEPEAKTDMAEVKADETKVNLDEPKVKAEVKSEKPEAEEKAEAEEKPADEKPAEPEEEIEEETKGDAEDPKPASEPKSGNGGKKKNKKKRRK